MNGAFDILERDHRRIEGVVSGMAGHLDGEPPAWSGSRRLLGRYVRFLREYADRIHHAAEEGCLFELLRREGLLADVAPVNVLLAEHAEARRAVRRLGELARRSSRPLGAAERGEAGGVVAELVALYRRHIAREDDGLLPEAARRLDDRLRARLDHAVRTVRERATGSSPVQDWAAEASRLGPDTTEECHDVAR